MLLCECSKGTAKAKPHGHLDSRISTPGNPALCADSASCDRCQGNCTLKIEKSHYVTTIRRALYPLLIVAGSVICVHAHCPKSHATQKAKSVPKVGRQAVQVKKIARACHRLADIVTVYRDRATLYPL